MPREASKQVQVRLTELNTKNLKILVPKTRRSLTQEANIAVEEYIKRYAKRPGGIPPQLPLANEP